VSPLQRVERYGSLIKLRPGFEERYIILHKHTFPGVLKRIRDSNIQNYSIFLREGMLFSYYEYTGQNHDEDMRRIGEDTVTQEWWKLTDPMQEPLSLRKEGEWWVSMDEVFYFLKSDIPASNSRRLATVAEAESVREPRIKIPESVLTASAVQKLAVFHKYGHLYLYGEYTETSGSSDVDQSEGGIGTFLSKISLEKQFYRWKGMREVFHTD
jgi:L-rhamnose mutarotase